MTQVQERTEARHRTGRTFVGLVVAVELAALVLWVAYDAAGIELTVRSDGAVHAIGLVSVLVTTAVVAAMGIGLRRLLCRRANGRNVWSSIAGVVWVLSFLGPLGATTMEAGLALASFHLAVGGGIFFGVRGVNGR